MTLIQKLTVALLVANFLVVAIAGYLLFAPVNLPVIYNEPFPVEPAVVKKGETLTYWIEVSKREEYKVEMHRNIVCEDGNLVTLSTTETNVPLGRHTLVREIIIPQKASFSTCHIELTAHYHINPLRDVVRSIRTQSFKIIP